MDDARIRQLDIVARTMGEKHRAIWEVEKHYTWFSYVLTGSILLALNIQIPIQGRMWIAFSLAVIGMLVAAMGAKVTQIESSHYQNEVRRYNDLCHALGLDGLPEPFPVRRLRGIIQGIIRRNLGIRDYFQLGLWIYAGLFFAGAATLLTLLITA